MSRAKDYIMQEDIDKLSDVYTYTMDRIRGFKRKEILDHLFTSKKSSRYHSGYIDEFARLLIDYSKYDHRQDSIEIFMKHLSKKEDKAKFIGDKFQILLYTLYHLTDKDFRNMSEEGNAEIGYYPYIAYSREDFARKLEIIMEKAGPINRFLDVGGGIADKALIAYLSGIPYSISIEFCEKLCEKARRSLPFGKITYINEGVNSYNYKKLAELNKNGVFPGDKDLKKKINKRLIVYNTDAFDYDFSYEQLVYLYVPISNHTKMKQLWIKIWNEIPKGAIILEVGEFRNMVETLRRECGVRFYGMKNRKASAIIKSGPNNAKVI